MRTKVVATLGPGSSNVETITKMVQNGVRILRLNFSHSDAESFKPVIAMIRQVEKRTYHSPYCHGGPVRTEDQGWCY